MARDTYDWLQANCPGFIENNHFGHKISRFEPTGLSCLGRHVEKVPQTPAEAQVTDELKVALQTNWDHFEYLQKGPFSNLYPQLSTKKVENWLFFRVAHILPEKTMSEMLTTSNYFFLKVLRQH